MATGVSRTNITLYRRQTSGNIPRRHSCYNSVYVKIVVSFRQEYYDLRQQAAFRSDGAHRRGRGWDYRAGRRSPGTLSVRCKPGTVAPGTTRRRAAAGTHHSLALADRSGKTLL